MRNHTQLKIFFAAVLIALTTRNRDHPRQVDGFGASISRPHCCCLLPSAASQELSAKQAKLC